MDLLKAVEQAVLTEAGYGYTPDNMVDLSDRYRGEDGRPWMLLGGNDTKTAETIQNEQQLMAARNECRLLAEFNEFAINGHENRISYVVGSGHTYAVAAKKDEEPSEDIIKETQAVIDEFVERNKWQQRQQEIVRRIDRDGEVFIRVFERLDGLSIRFVEPGQVATPESQLDVPRATFGILTDAEDVETIEGYFVDGDFLPAEQIQHRKGNVDFNVKRGRPLFWPVRKNLQRAEKILRNMSTVAEIQAAIALIRKHGSGTGATNADAFVKGIRSGDPRTDPTTGRESYRRRYEPGSILDVSASTEYEFPSHAIEADKFVTILQAELRAIAARLVMPEFMLTSDASNANFASTMVAEGPAVKMFDRLQWGMIVDDKELIGREIQIAVDANRLNQEALTLEVNAVPPNLATRDRLQEVQADAILVDKRAMSRETMSERHDLDPDAEKEKIDKEREDNDPFAGMPGGNPLVQQGGNDDGETEDRPGNG